MNTLKTDPAKVKDWQQRSRRRLATRSPLKCHKPLKRSGMKARRISKRPTVEGASERELRDEMDELIRQILRTRDEYYCIVCGVPGEHEDLHPGHYISRKVLALRWDLRNVWPQCDQDNREHNEHPEWYRGMLVMQIGEREVCKLERIAKENPRLEYSDLISIRDGLREELTRWLTNGG